MKTLEQQFQIMVGGLNSADNYISEDLEAICDETMQEWAEGALECVKKAQKAAELYEKTNNLFIDALTDISMHAGWCKLEFDDSHKRNQLLREWAWTFVEQHTDTDWENADYISLVDEFADMKVKEYAQEHPQTKYEIKVVLGTEACREYDDALDTCKKWSISSLADAGCVAEASFDSAEELAAYKEGIEDANGWLEARYMMTDEEWDEWVKEQSEEDEE